MVDEPYPLFCVDDLALLNKVIAFMGNSFLHCVSLLKNIIGWFAQFSMNFFQNDPFVSFYSGDGNDMNPALPDTSMKLGRYVYKHELFEIFSLANQNYSNFQDGGSKFQDGCQNKY